LFAERPNQNWIRTLAGWAALLTTAKVLVLDWSLWGFTLQSLCFDEGGNLVMVRWAVHAALWSLWLMRAFYKQHSKIKRVIPSASAWVALLLPWIFALIESSLLCNPTTFRINSSESWLALLWVVFALLALNRLLKKSFGSASND